MDVKCLWLGMFALFVSRQKVAIGSTVYVAIDRTTWGDINLLMVSFIWRKRGIPLYWQRLRTLGNSNLSGQKTALKVALSALSDYKVVVLGDREFCSVELARWLGEQQSYFCLRQKKSTHIQPHKEDWIALGELGLTPGTSCFYNQITVTESKGFGPVQVAGKWKRRYDGFAPDEPWFILTNLDNLDAAISAYQKRFSIEMCQPQCPHRQLAAAAAAVACLKAGFWAFIFSYKVRNRLLLVASGSFRRRGDVRSSPFPVQA